MGPPCQKSQKSGKREARVVMESKAVGDLWKAGLFTFLFVLLSILNLAVALGI